MQEMSEAHKDLLRNLIDQQLWLSKGKELGITGETELVNRLNEIRKQYNLATLEDLEKAAKEQGVSYEDFKANIRNEIITQDVMRQEVGRRISDHSRRGGALLRGSTSRSMRSRRACGWRDSHLDGHCRALGHGAGRVAADDPQKLAEAKAKADDIEARLHSGGDFSQLAKSFSDGPTAAEGGDLGQFQPRSLAKVLEDKTFALKAGEYTDPIRTHQGYVILKVVQHTPGGIRALQGSGAGCGTDLLHEPDGAGDSRLSDQDARRGLHRHQAGLCGHGRQPQRDQADSTAPIRRPRPRRSGRWSAPVSARPRAASARSRRKQRRSRRLRRRRKPAKKKSKKEQGRRSASMKPGKKEKIRFGKAPQETLPNAVAAQTEDAGALPQAATAAPGAGESAGERGSAGEEDPLQRSRTASPSSARPRQPQKDALAPQPPDAAEVADRQTQSAPLGLAGDTASKKKKKATTTGEKTRLSDRNKKADEEKKPAGANQTPPSTEETPQAPAPAPHQ